MTSVYDVCCDMNEQDKSDKIWNRPGNELECKEAAFSSVYLFGVTDIINVPNAARAFDERIPREITPKI